jgi:hypothetical protein
MVQPMTPNNNTVVTPEPVVTTEIITPEQASELLKANTNNRKMKTRRVNELVRAIKNGEWAFNGDAIRITNDGRLIDGQHRLAAIAAAGVPVKTVMFRGATDDDQLTIDLGAKRTFSDVLTMNGEKYALQLAAVTRAYTVYKMTGSIRHQGTEDATTLSAIELLRVLDQNPELRKSAHIAADLRGSFKMTPSVIGVAHRVLTEIDADDAAWFFSHLRSGTGLADDDRSYAVLKLREHANNRRDDEKVRPDVMLGTMFKAWNYFREGRTYGSIVWRAGGAHPEMRPVPA